MRLTLISNTDTHTTVKLVMLLLIVEIEVK